MSLEDHLSSKPRYRIHAVAEMIGLTTPNLRAWERRYGIPQPQRGENAYRLYSNRDITLLKRMKSLCDQGHAPSDAAQIAQRFVESELEVQTYPAVGYQDALARIIESTEAFQPQELDLALQHAQTLGSAWDIYQNILKPALIHIGQLWESDFRLVAHEHLLSQAVKHTLSQMLKLIMPPFPRSQILFACVEKELHDLAINALALRVAHAGYRPIVLGANTPPIAIANAVSTLKPAAVVLSITTPITHLYDPMDFNHFGQSHHQENEHLFTFDHPASFLAHSLFLQYADAMGSVPWLMGGPGIQEEDLEELPPQIRACFSSSVESLDRLLYQIDHSAVKSS